MKDTRVVDTNVLLRYLLADHEEHPEKAAAFLGQVRRGETGAYVCDAVVAECVYVLTRIYQVPRKEAASALEKLLRYKGICGPHTSALRRALRRYGSGSLSFVDTLLMEIANEQGIPVESFDRKLLNRMGDP